MSNVLQFLLFSFSKVSWFMDIVILEDRAFLRSLNAHFFDLG